MKVESYMEEIYDLLIEVLRSKERFRDDISVTDLLPIFIATLGSVRSSNVENFIHFFGVDNLKVFIVDQIVDSLGLE